jgi:hypothetical protein
MKKKFLKTISICLISFNSFTQGDYQWFSFMNMYQGQNSIENQNTGEITLESPRKFAWADIHMLGTVESNFYFDIQGAAVELLVPPTRPYSVGLLDASAGKTFNKNRPIKIGPLEFRFGAGLNLGFRFFDYKNSFLAYGINFHSFLDIGDNFQMLYINSSSLGYNARYENISRKLHEVYILYNFNMKAQFSFCPFIDKNKFTEQPYLENEHLHKYIGFKIGVVRTLE